MHTTVFFTYIEKGLGFTMLVIGAPQLLKKTKRILQGLLAAVARLVRAIMIVLYPYDYYFFIIFYRGGHVQRYVKKLITRYATLAKQTCMMKDEERT